MTNPVEIIDLTKRFGKKTALESVSLTVPPHSLIGLVGRNGSGKTTLLRHIVGLFLPTTGQCRTFGTVTGHLGARELEQIGFAQQRDNFLEWMRARQLIRYVSAFYPRWDRELEEYLLTLLDIDPETRIGTASPGTVQKISLVLATCHHPTLLLLDEPLSELDPIARHDVLTLLLDRFATDDVTMIISSHLLYDLERIVDRIVCLENGRLVADASLDKLKESFGEWIVASLDGSLPDRYDPSYVISADGDRFQARLVVRDPESHVQEFQLQYSAHVESHSLGLDAIFPLLVSQNNFRTTDRKPRIRAEIGA
jgi:ABC-2 type transport system ATP-binding protein